MQPPAHYELPAPVVNSFDLVFYESVGKRLADRLEADDFTPVDVSGMVAEEYEQFEVFADEAGKQGLSVSDRPEALWRCPVTAPSAPEGWQWDELGGEVAEALDEQVWGQTPGWFSRAYYQKMTSRTSVEIGPDRAGLERLEKTLVGQRDAGIRWIDPIAFQALCDFVGVVVQATTPLEVQWGTCPVDEQTGMAPAPLFRMRQPGGQWQRITVGTDVLYRACLPWGPAGADSQGTLAGLVDEYRRRMQGV